MNLQKISENNAVHDCSEILCYFNYNGFAHLTTDINPEFRIPNLAISFSMRFQINWVD